MTDISQPVALPTETNYVERWEQALRVLEAMTPHEREKHFNMGTWGEQTDCGTVACLAGHCALDPWFRGHGFSGEFKPGYTVLTFPQADPQEYFGERGYEYILTGPPYPWETIVHGVKEHIDYLKGGGDPNELDESHDYDWDDAQEGDYDRYD
jgi:hypothetical protein